MMQAKDVVNAYLTALYGGDFERARALLAEGFSFRGPFVQADGREAFLESAEGLRRIARGHTMLRQLHDGDSVCSLYELRLETPMASGSVPMAEWHRLLTASWIRDSCYSTRRSFER
jgi:ketosteroid isomerase-like protein